MIKDVSIKIIEIGKLKRKGIFSKQNFSKEEIKYCQSYKISYPHFAGRLSAKKAVIDTLGLNLRKVNLKEIEILNGPSGRPRVNLSGKVKKEAEKMKIRRFLVSISHSENYAIANVIAV